MKQTKKGFTLVELLVVIAILAILATVSVVGYTAFIQKAHQSNDRTLVAQLNKLIMRVDGEKYGNFHEVVEILQENGIDVTKLNATAKDYEILWDMDAQEFFYTADQVRNGLNIWIVSETLDTSHSTYYVGDATTIETTLGFDAGTSAVDVVFKGSDEVIIRTNGGNLTVESGNVTHYGHARYLTVADSATYTEKGTVVANVADIDKITDAEITAEQWTVVETADQLKQALEAEASKIVLGADIAVNDEMASDTLHLFVVTSDVEINLNGHNIKAHRQVASTFKASNNSLINVNKAKVTFSGYGIISLEQAGNNFGWNAYSSTISNNQGTVTINDAVVVEHLGGTDMAYAIDVLTNGNGGDAILQVNGGMVTSANYRAIRGFCNSTTNSVNITINGGHVYSPNNNAIWLQQPSEKLNNGSLTIAGGIIESAGYIDGADRKPFTLGNSANISATITNGQLIQNGVDVTAQYK